MPVRVPADAPPTPATCKVRFKMVDRQDREYYPATRPLFFDVIVTH